MAKWVYIDDRSTFGEGKTVQLPGAFASDQLHCNDCTPPDAADVFEIPCQLHIVIMHIVGITM